MRRLPVLLLLLFCTAGIFLGYYYWPKVQHALKESYRPSKEEEVKDQQKVGELLKDNKPAEALAIIKKYENFITPNTPEGKKWVDLLIEGSEKEHNVQQLVLLYDYFPEQFENRENAAIDIAHAYLASGRIKDFETLRDKWKGKETEKSKWFLLDGEKLIVDGKHDEAIKFFKSQTLKGEDETSRLLHLAWLTVTVNPQQAWDYLTEAHTKDPKNPAIRIYRARLLEAAGKTALALSEYIAAVQTAPNNLALRDQVGDFFRRYHQYAQAVNVWTESLTKKPESEFLWIKAWFWNKVASPLPKFDWAGSLPPEGPLKPLLSYDVKLSPAQYWDESAFEKIPNYMSFLRDQQSTFWLRLIQALKDKNEKAALELLKFNAFQKTSWDSDLETALKWILTYRATNSFKLETVKSESTNNPQKIIKGPESAILAKPAFFTQIETLADQAERDPSKPLELPNDLKQLILSDEVFAATFLASGWIETALQLHHLAVIPASFPDWVAYGMTQAYRYNRGIQEALSFATQQKQTPLLSLLEAELLIASGSPDAGLDKLQMLATDESDIGLRAAWIISLLYIDKKDFTKARDIINAHPKLAQSLVGKETLARIALLEGNDQLATLLYSAIEKESAEAKSFLARKAFLEKNWKKARELTEQLLLQYPTNTLVRQNLEKIVQEEQKEKQAVTTPIPNQEGKQNPQPATPN